MELLDRLDQASGKVCTCNPLVGAIDWAEQCPSVHAFQRVGDDKVRLRLL
jgi:hypothetical protein